MTLAVRFGLEETRVLEQSLPAQAYKRQGVNNIQTLTLATITKGAQSGIRQSFSKLNSLDSSLVLRVCGEVLILVAGFLLTLPFFSST